MRRDSAARLAAALVGLVLLSGCGGAAMPASSQPPASPSALAKPAASPAASAAAKPAGSEAASAAAPATIGTFRSALTSTTGGLAPLWIAIETGEFDRQGVKMTFTNAVTSAASAALVAGELDGLFNSSPTMINADAAGLDLLMVGSTQDHPMFSIYSQPNVTTGAQLKGQVVGCGKPGTPTEYGCLAGLKALGLGPNDVQLLRLDADTELYAALTTKQAAASALGPPQKFVADREGYKELTGPGDKPFQGIGLTVRRSQLDRLRPMIVPILKAQQIGVRRYNDDPDFAKQVIKKYTKNDDPEFLNRTYDYYRKQAVFRDDLKVNPEGIQEVATFLQASNAGVKNLKLQDLYDNSFADQLK
jgi:ABC-type nitrate/sulfonate/bicarbonate transport system substrate-binding protein